MVIIVISRGVARIYLREGQRFFCNWNPIFLYGGGGGMEQIYNGIKDITTSGKGADGWWNEKAQKSVQKSI